MGTDIFTTERSIIVVVLSTVKLNLNWCDLTLNFNALGRIANAEI